MLSMVTIYKMLYVLYFLYVVGIIMLEALDYNFLESLYLISWLVTTICICLIIYSLIFIGLGLKTIYILDISPISLLIVSGILLIMIVGGNYYLELLNYNTIQEKIQNITRTPITYQYGRTSDEIINRLGTHNFSGFFGDQPLESFYKTSLRKSKRILRRICGSAFNEQAHVRMDLLWYLYISERGINNLTQNERNYILNCTTERLLELLGPQYNGATDRASVLFTIFTGEIIERPQHINRYDNVKNYRPNIIWNLSFYQHQLIDHDNGIYSTKGPVLLLASTEPSYMESLLNNVPKENLSELISRMGLNMENYSIEQIQDDLSLYYNVFTRPINLGLPPNLYLGQAPLLDEILSYYTNGELVKSYEPREKWINRESLLNIIKNDLLGLPKWSIQSVNHCNNDDTMNIMTTELHGDMNKMDLDDPTLSYGIHKNYRCYQASELTASFREYDGVFGFRIPDWTDGATDPTTNELLPREFPIDSIKELASFIEKSELESLNPLLKVIRNGIKSLGKLTIKIKSLKNQYNSFDEDQKRTVKLYLSWLFTYAMWMRFWKGPGYSWPMKKITINNPIARTTWERASPTERGEHIFIQHSIRSSIMELYENDIPLKTFIDELPVIYYEFDTGDARLASYPLKETIDKIVIGKHCMGFGSDTILKTSYYYIMNLIDHNGEKDVFNRYINEMFPSIFELERKCIQKEIIHVQPNTLRYNILQNRLDSLLNPLPMQPGFVPSDYQNNVHV